MNLLQTAIFVTQTHDLRPVPAGGQPGVTEAEMGVRRLY